jgi:hypothetical protein
VAAVYKRKIMKLLIIGFTGTSSGMTQAQRRKIQLIVDHLASVHDLNVEAHHGDCIGADAQFHDIMRNGRSNEYIIKHPGFFQKKPSDLSHRANCEADETRAPKTHFRRNRDIVHESEVMIAAPVAKPYPKKGGTAYTIDYAIEKKKKVMFIVFPDGSVDLYRDGKLVKKG